MKRPFPFVFLVGLLAVSVAHAITVTEEGKLQASKEVTCGGHKGKVVVRTGTKVQLSETSSYSNMISIALDVTEGNALKCCWVQFSWTEVIATYKKGNRVAEGRVKGKLNTTGGEVTLTDDPAKPSWSVDSSAKKSPCYDTNGIRIKSRSGNRIFDQPGSLADKIGAKIKAPAGWSLQHVVDRKHFEAYLVCDGKPCCRVTWTQEYKWTPGGGAARLDGPSYTPKPTVTSVTKVRPKQAEALKKEYPKQTVIR